MIWGGEHKWSASRERAFTWNMIESEFKAGRDSKIPVCCIIYYLFSTRLYLLFKCIKIVQLVYLYDDKFFEKYQYYRCIFCKLKKKIIKVLWNGTNEWTYYYRRTKR